MTAAMGTRALCRGRSASILRTGCVPGAGTAERDLVGFQGTGRRAGYVSAVQIVNPQVTLTEDIPVDIPVVGAKLHGAIEVRTDRVEGAHFALGGANHQARLAAQVERWLGLKFQLKRDRQYSWRSTRMDAYLTAEPFPNRFFHNPCCPANAFLAGTR